MLLLFFYVFIAIGISFLCSISEAALLSVTPAHIASLEKKNNASGRLLRDMKDNVNAPLAAILTLNTIAHTMGAAGVGAQAAIVFGSAYVGVASVILTLLVLIFSEIIPKTLGAHYWRQLASANAYFLKYLIFLLHPFVKLSEKLTSKLTHGPTQSGFNREEFIAIADLSYKEGKIAAQESQILKNLLLFRETPVSVAMTPRTVIFSLPDTVTVEEFFHKYDQIPFSRIPIYHKDPDNITGFIFRSDLLLAQARGNSSSILEKYQRDITAIQETMSLAFIFNEMLRLRVHIMLVIDEYGGVEGIISLEDILETLLGLEIVDEKDDSIDMQKTARNLWKQRAKKMGLEIEDS